MSNIKMYLWMIKTIYEHNGMTKKDLIEKWKTCDSNDYRTTIAERSFFEHINQINVDFGLHIYNDRRTHKYCIDNRGLMNDDYLKKWLLGSFAVNDMLKNSNDEKLKRRIVYEKIPEGDNYLPNIIGAMKDNVYMKLKYQKFTSNEPEEVKVAPYGVKVFKQRWYLIAFVPAKKGIRIYALDRICSLERTSEAFDMPDWFDIDQFFEHSYGIFNNPADKAVTIKLKVSSKKQTCDYLRSLPLHASQKEIKKNEEEQYSIFQYELKPTYDFIQEILSYGEEVEVLSPAKVRRQCAEHIKALYHTYFPQGEENKQ